MRLQTAAYTRALCLVAIRHARFFAQPSKKNQPIGSTISPPRKRLRKWLRGYSFFPKAKEVRCVLAIAGTGYGLIGLLVVILLIVLIFYFVRRA